MGKTIRTETHSETNQPQERDEIVFAQKDQALELARAGATRWAGLLERLAK